MKRAFSLVELVVVMLIVGIIAVVAIVNSISVFGVRLTQAADKVKSDIKFVQSYALATQQRTRIAFDTAANSYTVYREPTTDNWVVMLDPLTKANFVVSLNQNPFKGVTISSATFVNANYHLVFDRAGIPWGYNPSGGAVTQLASAGTVVLSGNGTKTITVEPVTGKTATQ